VVEENASFNLLPSQDLQGYTSWREHQNIITNITVNMFNKVRHTAKVYL
jgi:hypothetical protein